jgi:hypothetical protein
VDQIFCPLIDALVWEGAMFELDLQKEVRVLSKSLWRSRQVWRLLLAMFPCGCMSATMAATAAKIPTTLTSLFVLLAIAFVFTEFAMYLVRTWWQCNHQSTVEEAIKHDPRPPILYLRPFKADGIRFSSLRVWADRANRFVNSININRMMYADEPPASLRTGEELIVSLIDPLGPVVAVGKPGERVPPVGAARLYLGDEWRDVVRDYMKRSQLVILFAGSTTHFAWEIGQLFRQDPFVPIFLFLPFFKHYRQNEVDRFTAIFHDASGLAIPSDLREARGIYFPNRSTVVPFVDRDDADERLLNGLNPFLGVAAQFMEQTRPGWGQAYIESAKEERRKSWRLMAVACAILALFVFLTLSRQSHSEAASGASTQPSDSVSPAETP